MLFKKIHGLKNKIQEDQDLLFIKKKYIENSHWPLNHQYLVKFEKNTKCKIILNKQLDILLTKNQK